jgi:glycosyltransferase involved in cell wall biosynthesis
VARQNLLITDGFLVPSGECLKMPIPAPISVVIPAHNAEKFLEEAIRSVHAQTLKVAEIIVVADDCTDRTPRIAANLGTTVIKLKRRNMAAGLNLGVKACSQPWIALLDADDFWKKDKIALQWKAIDACPAAAIVSCDLVMVFDDKVTTLPKRYLRKRWNNLEKVAISDHCYFLKRVEGDFLTRFFIATPTVILRRDVFSNVGLFDESLLFGQTLEFFARVLARFPLAFVARPLVYQRVHDRNHTRNFAGYWTSYISIVDRMLKNPDIYPNGAGEAYRKRLKRDFHLTERALARGL